MEVKMSQGEGGGRPLTVFTEDKIIQVEKLASVLSKAQLADYLNISENTFRAIEERQPEVSEAYKRGKAKAIGNVATNLIQQAQAGNTTAAIFYLKTQAGWKEDKEPERELPPIQIHVNSSNDTAE
jgi:DNA-binding XRE family transcriptional regulator